MRKQQVGNNGRGFQSKGENVTSSAKQAVVKTAIAEANVLSQRQGGRNRTKTGGEERPRNACGVGRLSSLKGMEDINAAAVWVENERTTLYRVNGEFWMSQELSLGEPERKVVHNIEQVSEMEARTFLQDRSGIDGIDEVENRIITLDQKDGVAR